MVKAVFDTNVLVSSLIRRGNPRDLWRKVAKGEIMLIVSPQILKEFDKVMMRPQLRRYITASKLHRFRRLLHSKTTLVRPRTRFPQLTSDPNDNILVETAFDGKAGYLVSGDKHLLALKEFEGIRIVTVSEMLKPLKKT
ncbi:MAG: putative toxin-antitoxin system toxin component, PIN family [Candidatus Bathyarchaeia archaeon]